MNRLPARVLALAIGLLCSMSAVRADDIDIYTNASDSPLQKPMTILVLDLNLLAICNTVLTQPSNPANPDAPQLCLDLNNTIVLSEVLRGVTDDPVGYLTNLLFGLEGDESDLAMALCDLYGLLGVDSPLVALPLLGPLLAPLLGGVAVLTCGTLEFLLSIPLLGDLLDGLLNGFIGQLVAGLVSPLLTTVVGALPATLVDVLNTTLSGLLSLGQVGLISLLESILNQLIDSQVAIVVSHGDRSSFTGAPASDCDFGEQAAIATTRRETPNCSNGAYFLLGATDLVDQGTVKDVLLYVGNLLGNILDPRNLTDAVTAILGSAVTDPVSLLPPYQGKEVYLEIAQYLAGDEVYNAPLDRWDGLLGVLGRDRNIESGGYYEAPGLECHSANLLHIQLTDSMDDDESDARLAHYFPGAVGADGSIALTDVVREAELTGFEDASGNRIGLNSYFLVQDNLSSVSALTSIGANLTTYVTNLGLLNLGQTVGQWLQPALVVDASLVTPSQTLDLSQPGRITGDAFFTLFRPDEGKRPRWPGNLKKLELISDLQGLRYVDVDGSAAIADDGWIAAGARTFWTDTGQLGGKGVDGRETTLGGAGQQIPGYKFGGGGNPGRANSEGKRKLYYETIGETGGAGGGLSLRALNADDGTVIADLQTALGAATPAETQELLLYARGFEVGTRTDSKGVGNALKGREWLHGAVLHSRPVAINYGARGGYSADDPDVRIVYGAADGYLRMVRNVNGGGAESGRESWAFMPRAIMPTQKILRDNEPGGPLPHGVDGAPTVLLVDRDPNGDVPGDGKIESGNAHDHAYLFFGLGRGGNLGTAENSAFYAMDITDPDSPELLWRLSAEGLARNTGTVASGAGWYADLAMSTSAPQLGRLRVTKNGSTEDRDVLFFGGGYYGGHSAVNAGLRKDAPGVGGDDAAGRYVYAVDALSGELIWRTQAHATMGYDAASRSFRHPLIADSIAADLVVLDSDGDGFTDRLYALDSGGRLWRGDLPGSEASAWTYAPIASVGRHNHPADAVTQADDRRFFQAPDYVPFRDANGIYDAIVFASGNRAAPLNTATDDYLYVFRDRDVVSGKALSEIADQENELAQHADFADLTDACANAAQNCADNADLSTGWRIELKDSGEKALSQPLTAGGVVFLSTYVPPDPASLSCAPREGDGKFYAVRLDDSRPVPYLTAFQTDNDGDDRSTRSPTPGLAGQFGTLGGAVTANTDIFEPQSRRYYEVYWRELRGDEAAQ